MAALCFLLLTYLTFKTAEVESTTSFVKEESNTKKDRAQLIADLNCAMKKLGINHPEVVISQMYLETGRFTSKVYRINNNPFGMRHNSRGYSKKSNLNHAYYETLSDALLDFKEWQQLWGLDKVESREAYIARLDRLKVSSSGNILRYAEDLTYTTKVRRILAKEILPNTKICY